MAPHNSGAWGVVIAVLALFVSGIATWYARRAANANEDMRRVNRSWVIIVALVDIPLVLVVATFCGPEAATPTSAIVLAGSVL
jgi:heme/copper-type cytochrome/quinol oxidase subunit 2